MSYTCNLENALIVGASTISIGLLSSGLLLTINENQIEYSRQKHNLKLKKYDRVEIDLLQYNIDLNDATQNEKIFFASDLQRAYEDELEPTIAHIYRSKQLNQTLPYEQY